MQASIGAPSYLTYFEQWKLEDIKEEGTDAGQDL